jgi:hypothetical protein
MVKEEKVGGPSTTVIGSVEVIQPGQVAVTL